MNKVESMPKARKRQKKRGLKNQSKKRQSVNRQPESLGCHYSIDLPPEIWTNIIRHFDAETMEKYAMLSKETLEHAYRISKSRWKCLLLGKFPWFCGNRSQIIEECYLSYYLPRIVIGRSKSVYTFDKTYHHDLPIKCEYCLGDMTSVETDNLRYPVDIDNVYLFRKDVLVWLNTYNRYKFPTLRGAVLGFIVEYSYGHCIIEAYIYSGIVKNYKVICKKENVL